MFNDPFPCILFPDHYQMHFLAMSAARSVLRLIQFRRINLGIPDNHQLDYKRDFSWTVALNQCFKTVSALSCTVLNRSALRHLKHYDHKGSFTSPEIFTFAGVSPPFFGVLEMSTVLLLCLIPISEICWSNGSEIKVKINA